MQIINYNACIFDEINFGVQVHLKERLEVQKM